jgi:ATP-dependent helicase/nuclease subunit A
MPFVLSVSGTLIRGSVDLLVERDDGSVLVVDYKTNRLDTRTPEDVAARYAVQRDLYALAAAARATAVETAYVFLERPAEPVRRRFEAADLDDARGGIERLLEKLGAGRFEVTVHPHRDLCLDCPARERLCSHRTADQLRDSPEPALEPRGHESNDDPGPAEGPREPQLSLLEDG